MHVDDFAKYCRNIFFTEAPPPRPQPRPQPTEGVYHCPRCRWDSCARCGQDTCPTCGSALAYVADAYSVYAAVGECDVCRLPFGEGNGVRSSTAATTSKADTAAVLCTSRYNEGYYCDVLAHQWASLGPTHVHVIDFAVYGDGSLGALQGADMSRLWVDGAGCPLRQIAIRVASANRITGTLHYEAPAHGDNPRVCFAYGKCGYPAVEVPTG